MELPVSIRRGRIVYAAGFLVGGTTLTALLLLALHGEIGAPSKPDVGPVAQFDVPEPPKPPPKMKKKKPKPKKKAAKPPPMPALTASLAGMSFGLPGFDGALDATGDALLGDVGDVVMTEDSVDTPPVPKARVAPEYPTRARSRNITGYVTFSLLVGADGSLQDVRILDAQPPGVFEEVARSAIRQWRFDPATYEGRPVTTRARQTLRFELE
ncbi:MAG: energy transducer TonB [Myxococcota bacterium]